MNQLLHFGQHTHLPLDAHVISAVHFDGDQVTLRFAKAPHSPMPQLTLSDAIVLKHRDKTLIDTRHEPLDATELACYGQLLALMWAEVIEAVAYASGALVLTLSNEMTLCAWAADWHGWQYHGYGQALYGRQGQLR